MHYIFPAIKQATNVNSSPKERISHFQTNPELLSPAWAQTKDMRMGFTAARWERGEWEPRGRWGASVSVRGSRLRGRPDSVEALDSMETQG